MPYSSVDRRNVCSLHSLLSNFQLFRLLIAWSLAVHCLLFDDRNSGELQRILLSVCIHMLNKTNVHNESNVMHMVVSFYQTIPTSEASIKHFEKGLHEWTRSTVIPDSKSNPTEMNGNSGNSIRKIAWFSMRRAVKFHNE